MDDLITELRAAASRGLAFAPQYIKNHLCWIAADRIADLERQLAELRQPTAQQGSLTSVEDARDAARYRYAKHNISEGNILPGGYWLNDIDSSSWDKTIDAALQAGKEKE